MSKTVEKHTVSMHFVSSAVAHLPPASRKRVLEAAGIQEQLVLRPAARVPAEAFSDLWLGVAKELDDEFFGLDHRSMRVGSFALICQAVISCSDLDSALKRMLRGFGLFLNDVAAELLVEDSKATISISNRIEDEADRRFADETMLVLVHGLMSWLAGRRVPLEGISFTHRRPNHAHEYSLMFCEDVRFEEDRTSMRFLSQFLAAPVVQNDGTLKKFLRTAPQSVFLKYRNEDSWSAKLRRNLRNLASESEGWPTLDQLSSRLGTTSVTLRRRLDREGTSFQSIKDQLRNDVAIDYLYNSDLSVDEIGARLGYQDASAFHRAFRRWNGVQPGEYRRQKGSHEP